MTQARNHQSAGGFTLVEVLLALSFGVFVVGLIAQALLAESGHARRLGRLLRERLVAQRALALIADEVQQGQRISRSVPNVDTTGCGLSGRRVRLYLELPAGMTIYSVETNPNSIWRGAVLMRCGPAYGLDGALKSGTRVSSVLVDAVTGNTLTAQASAGGMLLQLERSFSHGADTNDPLRVELPVSAPNILID